ncbi:MAG TPA: thioesterase family protein [Mycobacteriales bacterium]|nr:thioesterase family protein [Mycobacteriales bacterium]
MPAESFYEVVGSGRVRSTEHTVGPWAPTDQHAGPPSALLVRAIEGVLPAGGRVSRVTVDLLGAVPVAELSVTAQVLRPGRSVQLATAELTAGGSLVARATAWWHRASDTTAVAAAAEPPPWPDGATPEPVTWSEGGYLAAMEWVPVAGGFNQPGPATLWARMRYPLVAGEEPTGLQRLLTLADSGNGASWRLDPARWLFVNTELTVHVLGQPTGEWLCLDASTEIGVDGTGLAASSIFDRSGRVARGAQALLIRPRTS